MRRNERRIEERRKRRKGRFGKILIFLKVLMVVIKRKSNVVINIGVIN